MAENPYEMAVMQQFACWGVAHSPHSHCPNSQECSKIKVFSSIQPPIALARRVGTLPALSKKNILTALRAKGVTQC